LLVDNYSPAAPVGLATPTPVSSINHYSISWALPADSGAPIVAARYQVCQGGACGAVRTSSTPTRIDDLTLPAPGSGSVRVWLVDQLGHEDPAGAAAGVTVAYAPATSVPPPSVGGPVPGPELEPPPAVEPEPRTTPKASPALKLSTLSRRGRRVTVSGTVSPRTSGRLTVRYRARFGSRTTTVSRSATIRRGRFTVTFTLPLAAARAEAGTVTVRYAGDADTAAATRTATLRLKSNRPRPHG
jgi:hypothetical protein